MSLKSLEVCMDSPDWFQGTVPEELKIDSISPSGLSDSDSILSCSQPLMDRRLRPPQDHPLKCPRCDSTHTKFCYYNNYSLTQPRYFCKTCRRYWTKGGTLRNIPVGGRCRKPKKVVSTNKKTTIHNHKNSHLVDINPNPNYNHNNNNNNELVMSSTDLQLSYPEAMMKYTGLNLYGNANSGDVRSFMFENMSSGYYGGVNVMGQSYHGGICSPFGGMTLDSINGSFVERGLIGYNHEGNGVNDDRIGGFVDVKPNVLALEWQDDDQTGASATSSGGGGSGSGSGYLTGFGSSWGGSVHGYGPPTTNPLV